MDNVGADDAIKKKRPGILTNAGRAIGVSCVHLFDAAPFIVFPARRQELFRTNRQHKSLAY